MTKIAPTHIQPGDAVTFDAATATVSESIDLMVDGYGWRAHRLVGHPRATWVTVEVEDGVTDLLAWSECPGLETQLGGKKPGDRSVQINGEKAKRREDGTGTYSVVTSTSPTARSGRYEYVDYELGSDRISFERYDDGPWEASRGRQLARTAVLVERPDA